VREDFDPLIKTRARKISKLDLEDKRSILREDPEALWMRFHLTLSYLSLESKNPKLKSIESFQIKYLSERSKRAFCCISQSAGSCTRSAAGFGAGFVTRFAAGYVEGFVHR
jgi:hypothetical protein